jgi:hypothetical protein
VSEQTIAAPLSAEEIINDVCDKVKQSLLRDCHLNPALAYESYSGKIAIKLRLKDCRRLPEIEARVEFGAGEISEDSALEAADLKIYDRPPNQVRADSGQPVPTAVTDSQGRVEIKGIRYQRKRSGEDEPIPGV